MPGLILMFSPRQMEKAMGLDGISNRLLEFSPHHPRLMNLREIDRPVFEGNNFEFVKEGQAWTGISKDKLYVCFGFHLLWDGVAEAWLIPDRDLGKKRHVWHRASLKWFDFIAKELLLWRFQAHVCSDNSLADRWISSVLFKKEGLCKRYGPDCRDYSIYGRLF